MPSSEQREDDELDFGVCCACRERRATGITMLAVRAPVAGTGWGCIVCRMPMDGAVAALCDECGEDPNRDIVDVIYGPSLGGGRKPLSMCTIPFKHDPDIHARHDRRLAARGN